MNFTKFLKSNFFTEHLWTNVSEFDIFDITVQETLKLFAAMRKKASHTSSSKLLLVYFMAMFHFVTAENVTFSGGIKLNIGPDIGNFLFLYP